MTRVDRSGQSTPCDLLVTGGRVIDPSRGIDERTDIAVGHGRIIGYGQALERNAATTILDASGLIVTPGLIDLHTHLYAGVSELGVVADATCLPAGVTTAVDAGSAGSSTFPGFLDYCIRPSTTRILAFLNLARIGLILDDGTELGADLRYADVTAAARTIGGAKDTLIGIKVRVGEKNVGPHGLKPLRLAIDAASEAGCKIMVHLTSTPLAVAEILAILRPGDIVTHAFHRSGNGIVDAGRVLPAVRAARERGVLFDVGHGSGSFAFETARAALRDGFPPDTISTDLHTHSIKGPVFDLPTTMSKLLALGMPLAEVIAAVTRTPARIVGLDDEIGTLAVGACADLALLRLEDGAWELTDSLGVTLPARQRLFAAGTVRNGAVVGRPQADAMAGA